MNNLKFCKQIQNLKFTVIMVLKLNILNLYFHMMINN